MTAKAFYLQLALVTLIAAATAFGINTFPQFADVQPIAWISLGIFVLLSVVMYYAGRKAAFSDNKHDFTNVSLGVTIGKIFIAILFILGYNQLMQPDSRFFIIPFFLMYLIYTIFETYIMMKLGRLNTPTDQKE
ncbi:MAG: hypothetical protein ACE362_18430 [Phaeodactylibacter xiamenensis]|uniref:Uncharacterized protein n=1 Tax=Phaeodactylibacter xiamenensis TaxID=1524460 RepID=A0A098SB65_9BACT|nr:hypothetical protein [Phaeodactylibacter xiamenensis]KGE89386.1 hypothetical protein IX84_03480 [Phaeodactylibacter xiamenensis]MCR9054451.1 hypothetical protein [bacterium]